VTDQPSFPSVGRSTAFAILGFALAACSGGLSLPLFEANESGYIPLAQITGTLTVRGPCLVLVKRAGETTNLAWPSPGTAWDPEVQTITVDGVQVSTGQEVTLIGGEVHGLADDGIDWLTTPLDECATGNLWAVHIISEEGANPPEP